MLLMSSTCTYMCVFLCLCVCFRTKMMYAFSEDISAYCKQPQIVINDIERRLTITTTTI